MENVQEIILQTLDRLEGKKEYFGRIIVQKAFYFLCEVFGVTMPFAFTFYHYGPYSSDLQCELDRLELFGLLKITPDPAQAGYSYHLTNKARQLLSETTLLEKLDQAIERATEFVSNKTPKELELLSTIHFVTQVHHPTSDGELVGVVQFLKPQFSPVEIEENIFSLRNQRMIP